MILGRLRHHLHERVSVDLYISDILAMSRNRPLDGGRARAGNLALGEGLSVRATG